MNEYQKTYQAALVFLDLLYEESFKPEQVHLKLEFVSNGMSLRFKAADSHSMTEHRAAMAEDAAKNVSYYNADIEVACKPFMEYLRTMSNTSGMGLRDPDEALVCLRRVMRLRLEEKVSEIQQALDMLEHLFPKFPEEEEKNDDGHRDDEGKDSASDPGREGASPLPDPGGDVPSWNEFGRSGD